ncbi:MAG: S-layer homology domain-containing protein, partial [Clostridia bacterium]|nr:S-layer homology domain-containing protein [Clostridia bacterium]
MKRFKLILASIVLAVIMTASIITAFADGKMPFTDVKNDWYYSSVEYVWERGIMKGISDKLFSPFGLTTRAEIVTVLSRLSGEKVDGMSASQSFKDVAGNEWYADSVGWGVSNKIVNGYVDNTFRPNSPVSRQELATFIARYMKFKNLSFPEKPLVSSFKDQNKIAVWAADSCETVRLAGIIGCDEKGNFNPGSNATRAEIATMIMENSVDPMFAACDNIYDLTEGEGRTIDVNLFYRDRIADHGTSRSLSEQLLPQMGLDTETYEFVFSMGSATHESLIHATDASITGGVVSNNKGEELGDNFGVARAFIRNKVTGEETKTINLFLKVKRSLGEENLNPDDFEPGLVDGAYEAMTEAAMTDTSLGEGCDLSRYANLFEKAEKGEPLNVTVIGGSITRGASAGDLHCWGKQTYNWIQKEYPSADISYVNAGIDGTGSDLGVIRFDSTVLRHKPDLLIFEFALNDGGGSNETREGFETMVRRVLSMPNKPAVMILFVGDSNDVTSGFMKNIARKYGIAVADCDAAAKLGIENDWIYHIEVNYDGAHPREWFHTFMADMLVENLKRIREKIKTASADELVIKDIPADRITEAEFED